MPARPSPLRTLIQIVTVVALAFAVPAGCVVGWFSLAFGRHSFGSWDPRALILVRGTWTESIGVIEPEPGSVRYETEGPDGPGVGFLRATYRTRAAPDAALEAFRAGCTRIGLTVEPNPETPPDEARRLGCTKDDLRIVIAVTGQEVAVTEDVP